jgi:hypothetical protein
MKEISLIKNKIKKSNKKEKKEEEDSLTIHQIEKKNFFIRVKEVVI